MNKVYLWMGVKGVQIVVVHENVLRIRPSPLMPKIGGYSVRRFGPFSGLICGIRTSHRYHVKTPDCYL